VGGGGGSWVRGAAQRATWRHKGVAVRLELVAAREAVAVRHVAVVVRHVVVAARRELVTVRHEAVAVRHKAVAVWHKVVPDGVRAGVPTGRAAAGAGYRDNSAFLTCAPPHATGCHAP
jgi:hypothetical protein